MDTNKRVINSEQISKAITSRRAPENENQVKLKHIWCAAAADYHHIETYPVNDKKNISAYDGEPHQTWNHTVWGRAINRYSQNQQAQKKVLCHQNKVPKKDQQKSMIIVFRNNEL